MNLNDCAARCLLPRNPVSGLSIRVAQYVLKRGRQRKWPRSRLGIILGSLQLLLTPIVYAQQAEAQESGNFPVLTRSYDNSRNGVNLRETQLRPSNVNVSSFGRLFTRTVDGQIYAQPLYVPDLEIPGKGKRNVVFVATMHNSIYAFDADDPAEDEPLWHVSFINPRENVYPVPSTDVGQECLVYRDIEYEIGILSTPVIDIESATLYVVVRTREHNPEVEYVQRLHAIDIRSGKKRRNSPVDITAVDPCQDEPRDTDAVPASLPQQRFV
jgi:hypothetical protein